MKKLLFATLCIALAASLFTGCGRNKDMETTTTPTTTATSPTNTTPAIEEIIPTVDSMPTTPSQEASEMPSTIAPEGGTGSGDARTGNSHRSMMGDR